MDAGKKLGNKRLFVIFMFALVRNQFLEQLIETINENLKNILFTKNLESNFC